MNIVALEQLLDVVQREGLARDKDLVRGPG